jgi:hypothetical protein
MKGKHKFIIMNERSVIIIGIEQNIWEIVTFQPLENISASGIIKFLAGSCLSGLGIVLKKP